jgi:transcriptional regulator with XRE-family HTH domain
MKITQTLSDEAILRELGARLARLRLQQNLTQAELAEQAGLAKRTVERIESGGGAQIVNIVRMCRVLGMVEAFDHLIAAPAPSPLEAVGLGRPARKRAGRTSRASLVSTVAQKGLVGDYPTILPAKPLVAAEPWRWGEDIAREQAENKRAERELGQPVDKKTDKSQ